MVKTNRRRRRKRRSRRGMTANAKANLALKKISFINSKFERKYLDINLSNQDCNTSGTIIYLNDIDQGNDVFDRDGDKVLIKSIRIRGYFHNDHGTPEDCVVRIMVVRRSATDGTAPALTNILASTADVNQFRNKDWTHEVFMLYDQTFAMDTTQHSLIPFKINLEGINKISKYDASGSGVADCQFNGFFLVFLSTVAGTTNDPLVTLRHRTVFTDN